MLLRHLPRESSYVQAVAGDRARWSETEYLLAAVIDVGLVGNYLTTRAHFQGTPKPPKPFLRPGDRPTADPGKFGGRRRYTQAQMRAILDNWGKGNVIETETREV